MNKMPQAWSVEQIAKYVRQGDTSANVNGKWVPARPEGFWSWKDRYRLAYAVFTGKADALFWDGQ